MVRVLTKPKLSVILPTLNESQKLPLLLAELTLIDDHVELIIVDANSKDLTRFIGELAGAKVLLSTKANRGYQLNCGSINAKGEWLLFLHSDSKLPRKSSEQLRDFIKSNPKKCFAWFFNFRTNRKGIIFKLLEIAVFIRSNIFKVPYGDQGLLISNEMYIASGGYKDLYIMEDLEFITRLSKQTKLKALGISLITDGRRWKNGEVLKNAMINSNLRSRWKKGESSESLYKKYYSKNHQQKT